MSIACVEIVYGMEKKSAKNRKWFIELNHKYIVSHIIRENVNYSSDTLQNNGIVVFPLDSLTFLEIEKQTTENLFQKQETKRFFVAPSMISKRMSCEAFMVRNRMITDIAVVRGITESKDCDIWIYMGFNNKAFKSNSNGWANRIFTASIMGIEMEEKKTQNHYFWYFHDPKKVTYLNNSLIPNEITYLNEDIYIKKHAINKGLRD